MSTLDAIEWDETRIRPQGQADTRPEPTFFETAGAGFRYARDDQTGHIDEERQGAYGPVITALKERGYDPRRYVNPYGSEPVNYDAVWRDIGAARRSDPNAFEELGDREAFEKGWRTQFAERQRRDASIMQRGGFVGALAGGLVGSLTDPINVGGMVLTGGWGGTSIAGRMLAEAAINTGIEALETPLTIVERAKQGRELTGEEIAMNLGFAAAGGAAFKGAEIGGRKLAVKAWESVPQDVRAAWALRQAVPDYAITPDQAAALHIIDRGFEVDSSNPFAGTYDSMEAHARRIDETIAAMSRWPEPTSTQALTPVKRPSPIAGASLRTDFEAAWRAIIGNEGGTNRDGSFRTSPKGAIGPAQVMPGTAPEAARLAGLPWDEAKYRSDHAYNVALGQAYYRDLLRQFDGDPVKAAAAYNAGPGSARRGTGLRGAMERARRAGVPDEWVSFLPGETRQYVADFRRRTSIGAGDAVDMPDLDLDMPTARAPELDADRPMVDGPDDIDLPELRRDLFQSDAEWRAAQAVVDAEAFGGRSPLAAVTELPPVEPGMVRLYRGEAQAGDPSAPGLALERGAEQPGLWFAREPEIADGYAGELGGRLYYVDIPEADLDGATARFRDHDGSQTYQLKPEWTDRRQSVADAAERYQASGSAPSLLPVENAAPAIQATRRGDFFEIEGPDATAVAKALGVAVTSTRAGDPSVGIPAHVFERWTADLAEQGIRVVDAAAPSRVDVAPTGAARDELEALGAAGPVVPDVEAGRVFDEPGSDAIGRTADLAWHDAQMMVATRADDGLTFDLGDGKGERSFADIEAELKADEDAISTIEGCLAPAPLGAAA